MKRTIILSILIIAIMVINVGCGLRKVPAGYVGIKVYLLGGKKGVDVEELKVGRYWLSLNQELYLFPTFTQNYVWTQDKAEGSPEDESITFQDKEGLVLKGDFGISYHVNGEMASLVFQKYRRGIEEITDIFLRNMVRNALNEVSSQHDAEWLYGEGKAMFMRKVEAQVSAQVDTIGLVIEQIYIIGQLRLPENVTNAINMKIQATQKAQQRENEVAEAAAAADKKRKTAAGIADSITMVTTAEAAAMIKKAKAVSNDLIAYELAKRWDGKLPSVTSGAVPFIDINKIGDKR